MDRPWVLEDRSGKHCSNLIGLALLTLKSMAEYGLSLRGAVSSNLKATGPLHSLALIGTLSAFEVCDISLRPIICSKMFKIVIGPGNKIHIP